MFLKDHLKDIYQKASIEKNYLMIENIINRWAHRFGIESLTELIVESQDQIRLIEEDQVKETHNQINLEFLENVQYEKVIDYNLKETRKSENTDIFDKDTFGKYKNKSENEIKELPLPNITNLRKWINNEKKAI